jgi:hypothetical protein
MTRTTAFLFAIALAAVVHGGSAQAEVRCSEGRTRSGECINPGLAHAMRHAAIVNAQPKISLTAPLNLPSEDRFYPTAYDHHEGQAFFGLPSRPGTIVP